jgi:class 3 adenylate cyclase
MLGHGDHFIFREPKNAVLGSLELVEKAEPLGLPPTHVGGNAGPIYSDGDYYGFAVILAARIAAEAGPGQVDGDRFESIGPVSLKGVTRPVSIYRAVRAA